MDVALKRQKDQKKKEKERERERTVCKLQDCNLSTFLPEAN